MNDIRMAWAVTKRSNRSLKSELIFIHTSRGCGRSYQIPRRGEHLGIAERMPRINIKVPVSLVTAARRDMTIRPAMTYHPCRRA
jgi:hypothetical protein